MNKKARKAYDKAMDCYEKGKINKALEICEEALSEGLDNPIVLNFKGLLLYQKGNLNEAITVWRINEDLNNNSIAKNYIKDAIADEKRLELYKQGEKAIKQLKVDEALQLFMRCAESDFNAIKVNTGIAMCYQKKGDLYKAKEYIDKALSIDENATTAKIIEKELKEDGLYLDSKNSSKGLLIAITILAVFFAIVAGGYSVIYKFKDVNLSNGIEDKKNKSLVAEGSASSEDKEKTEVISDNSSKEITKEESKAPSIDREKLKALVTSSDLYGVYEQLTSIKEESLSGEDAEVYKQAVDLMKNQGVAKFYEDGLGYFNASDYSNARIVLDKAYKYSEGSSLKEHILFYRASNSLKILDNKVTAVQYEEYYNQYPKGVYVEEALYELALLNNSIDKEKSKNYANILMDNFPDSIYVNDKVMSIAES